MDGKPILAVSAWQTRRSNVKRLLPLAEVFPRHGGRRRFSFSSINKVDITGLAVMIGVIPALDPGGVITANATVLQKFADLTLRALTPRHRVTRMAVLGRRGASRLLQQECCVNSCGS